MPLLHVRRVSWHAGLPPSPHTATPSRSHARTATLSPSHARTATLSPSHVRTVRHASSLLSHLPSRRLFPLPCLRYYLLFSDIPSRPFTSPTSSPDYSPPLPTSGPHLGVPLADPATVMRRHERAVEVAPKHARDAALGALNAEDGLGLLLLHVLLQLCQMDHRLRAHERIRRKRKHALADGQRDRTARLLLLELKELLARRQVPHAHRLVSRRREQARRVDCRRVGVGTRWVRKPGG
eukprot:363348-Chlamydomonas_euryale.AAC.12